jgi:hypothetical protein
LLYLINAVATHAELAQNPRMVPTVASIQTILTGGGTVKFLNPTNLKDQNGPGEGVKQQPNVTPYRIWTGYIMCKLTANTVGNTIEMLAKPEDDKEVNAVNVIYEADWAKIGDIMAPGFVYTDSMSGCVFYLYRGIVGDVHGVHASRQSGKLIDPTQYFIQRGGKELYKWDSQGLLIGALQGGFGAVLCRVDEAQIDIFTFALKAGKVERVFSQDTIGNWRQA